VTATIQRVIGGMSTERLRRVDDHLDRNYVSSGKIPGALTLVARRGEIAHLSPIGQMDAERGKPVTEDTIFRIYSMSKPITSVALMSLYEEGRFQLDDPAHKFIPEWENLQVWVGGAHPSFLTKRCDRPMTLRDLLSHQSGLSYGFHMRNSIDAAYRELGIMNRAGGLGLPRETLADSVKKLANVPLQFSPGTAWNYSISTDVCGYLVEVISGKRFDQFLQERIFDPLGMVDSAFHVPGGKLDRFAACYAPKPGGGRVLQDDPQASEYREPPMLFSGGGGMVSTAHDYYRFCQMLLNGGELDGVRILGRKTIELMTMNHLPNSVDLAAVAPPGQFSEVAYAGTGFGLGFSVLMDRAKAQIPGSPGQFAWGGAASTAFWIDPVEEVIVVFMTQLLPSSTYPFRRELQVLVNQAIVD
jgi:CubicO group peptidase (beta-lactamase class C family)